MYPEPSTRNTWSPLPAAFAATGLAAVVAAAGLVSAALGAAALVSALAVVFGELLGMAAMYEFLRALTALGGGFLACGCRYPHCHSPHPAVIPASPAVIPREGGESSTPRL